MVMESVGEEFDNDGSGMRGWGWVVGWAISQLTMVISLVAGK